MDTKYSFSIEFKLSEQLPAREEDVFDSGNLLTDIRGFINARDVEQDCNISQAAYVEAYILDVDRANLLDESIYDVCDSLDCDFEGHASTFYGSEFNVLKDDLGIDSLTDNTIILQYLLITEQFRNLNLGKLIVDSLIRNFGTGCAAIILQAVPLQFKKGKYGLFQKNDKMGFNNLEQDENKANKKLINAWKNLGFKVYEENFMYKPL